MRKRLRDLINKGGYAETSHGQYAVRMPDKGLWTETGGSKGLEPGTYLGQVDDLDDLLLALDEDAPRRIYAYK